MSYNGTQCICCQATQAGLPDGDAISDQAIGGNDKMTYTANQVIVAAIVGSKETLHAHKVSSVAALAH